MESRFINVKHKNHCDPYPWFQTEIIVCQADLSESKGGGSNVVLITSALCNQLWFVGWPKDLLLGSSHGF